MRLKFALSIFVLAVCVLRALAQSSPAVTGIIRADGAQLYAPTSIDVQEGFAYVGTLGSNGLEILNVQDPSHPSHVANIFTEYPNAVKAVGNFVYLASGSDFITVSITDKSHPFITDTKSYGQVSGQPHMAHDGNFLYVTVGNEFQIFSLTNPAHPALMGKVIEAGVHDFQAIDISGHFAYITSAFDSALKIIDISDPANPQQAGIIHDGDGGAALQGGTDVIVRGNYAYVVAGNSQALEIVDVSNPAAPVHATTVVSGQDGFDWSGPRQAAASGNFLYLSASSPSSVLVIDITNSASPTVVGAVADGDGSATIDDYVADLFVAGDQLYVANTESIEILNVSTLASPTHQSLIASGDGGGGILLSGTESVAVSGNYAYAISQGSRALEVVDISNPKAPTHHGSLQAPTGGFVGSLNRIAVSGTYAYIAGFNIFQVINISNPASPSFVTKLLDGDGGASILPNVTSLAIAGNYAYITSSFPGTLEIIDISDPAHPVHKGKILDGDGGAILGSPQRVAISGHYAYITDFFYYGLEVIDIANPALPVHAAFLGDGVGGADMNGAFGLAVSGNYAFVGAAFSNALEIVNVTDPTAPVHAGKISNGDGGASIGFTLDIVAVGNYVYLNGMEIIDVSNKSAPVHAGKLADPSHLGGSFSIVGNYAYALEPSGLEVINLNAPAAPVATDATGITTTAFMANWNSVAGATGYELDVSTTDFQTFVPNLQAKPVSALTFNVTPLTPGLTYQYRVRVITAAGTSDNSNIIEVILPKGDQTITFDAINTVTIGDANFELAPTSSSGLAVTLSSTSSHILITDYHVGISSAGRTSITANQAGDVSWNPAPPVTQSFCINPAKPVITLSSGVLTSSASSGNQWFLNGTEIASATSTTFTPDETGNYTVQSHVDDCFSLISTPLSFVVTGDIQSAGAFSLYPNPTENYLYVKGSLGINNPVAIYSVVGTSSALTFIQTGDDWSADVRHLSPGVYFLRVMDRNGIRTEKFLKK